jgi:hypothetical protein
MHELLAVLQPRAQQKQAATSNNRRIADYFRCDAVTSSKVGHPQRFFAANPFHPQ